MAHPLMPKGTAVWLVDNTTLTFKQIADFCGLHELEIQAIADGDVAIGMQGLDPIKSGALAAEEIERCMSFWVCCILWGALRRVRMVILIDSGAIIAPGLVRARHGARIRSQPAPVSCSTRATRFLYPPGRFGHAASSGVRYAGSEWLF